MFNPFGFVQHKDLPNIQTMFGNMGNSWNNPLPNDLFINGVSKNIHKTIDNTGIGNQGAGLDLLHSFTLPAKTLRKNGDYLDVIYGGSYANTEANKQLRLRIDSQPIISFGAVIDLENGEWYTKYRLYRASPTLVIWTGIDMHVHLRMADGAIITSPSGSFLVPRTNSATVANLDNNNVVLEVHGEGTADGDVLLKIADICVTRF